MPRGSFVVVVVAQVLAIHFKMSSLLFGLLSQRSVMSLLSLFLLEITNVSLIDDEATFGFATLHFYLSVGVM